MSCMVITGATGFLGSSLMRRCLERGDTVWAVIRPGSAHRDSLPAHPRLNVLTCRLDEILDHVAEIGRADAWFHFAWGGVNREEIDSPKLQEENIRLSLDCVKAAHLLQCKVFLDAGSRVEYGVTDGVMTEEMECHPVNQYGMAKLWFFRQAAAVCGQLGLRYCHLRFFSVYGYGDHPWSIISTLIRELGNGQTVSLSACLHEWNFMYIDDAVEAVLRLYGHMACLPEPGAVIVNVASEDTRVLKEYVEEVKVIIGGQGGLEYGTFVQAKEGALSIRPDLRRLRSMTDGWKESYTFRQGILETMRKEVEREDEKDKYSDPLLQRGGQCRTDQPGRDQDHGKGFTSIRL